MIQYYPVVTGSLTVTGSVLISGSITASGGISISGPIASASYAATASYWSGSINNVLSASYAATAANAALLNNTSSAQFAVTSSNTFTGNQYVSATTVPNGFSGTTAAIYTDGGLQVTKDTYLSSSLYIKGNLTVYGTESISYITSSQLNIATNLITVNTSTPAIRFGGLAVQDSGSVNGLTGSLLWDSQNNVWIYSNPSGSGNYDSAMVLMGPQNSSGLGNETGITFNSIPKGAGSHHMTSSAIFEVSGSVGIGNSNPSYSLDVTGTGRFTGAITIAGLTSTGTISLTPSSFAVGSSTATDANSLTTQAANSNYLLRFKNAAGTSLGGFYYDGTNFIADGPSWKFGNAVNFSTGAVFSSNASLISTDNSILAYTNSYMYIQGTSAGGLWLAGGSTRNNNIQIDESGSRILFYSGNSERMRITSAGNVGVGITNPTQKLEVNGGLRISDESTYGATISHVTPSGAGGVGMYADGGQYLHFGISSTDTLNISQNNNVIIGTNTDSGYKFDVSGTGRFTSNLSVGGYVAPSNGVYLLQGAGNNAAIGSTRGGYSTTFAVNLASILPGMNFGSNNYALWITLMQTGTSITYNALIAGGGGTVNTINSAGTNRITGTSVTGTASAPILTFTSSQNEYWSIIILCCGT